MPHRDLFSWASALAALNLANRPTQALSLLPSMLAPDALHPNNYVLSCLNRVYAGSCELRIGRVPDDALAVFDSISIKDSICWTAVISGYARSVLKSEALELFQATPWGNLLFWTALILGFLQSGSNTNAFELFNKMRREGMDIKKPGFSHVDIGKENQAFYAEETNHPFKDEICVLLKELELDMRRRGYVPDTSGVLLDMGQEEKERLLFWHSERLAAAYELIKTVPGSIIRIVKNLQVCADCHRVLKFVSDIVKRDIYVRGWDMFLQ
ncbi:hypothetical protein CRG98_001416 [Punica granatum]|uniref:DYW domain-containing protein n=1 Tax=Punica granatum TaxID=22663 RepID=A0A2I0LBY7_PUNGR|nr:hypothetical protein CRG98_001416 [Punica granatum]